MSSVQATACHAPPETKTAHQIGNAFDGDLVYFAIGPHDPHEICVYPDTSKLMVGSQSYVGFVAKQSYMEGEPSPPKILGLRAPPLWVHSSSRYARWELVG